MLEVSMSPVKIFTFVFFLSLLPTFVLAKDKEQSTLRFITYNTWGLPAPLTTCPSRFKKIAASIGQFNADIIAFEETFAKRAKVLELKEYPYHLYGPGKSKGIKILPSGLLILSKFPIIESDYKIYSKCGGFDCFANKAILWMKIKIPGVGAINVFATHTNAGTSMKIKTSQLDEAWEFIQRHLEGRSTVFMGDFNMSPETPLYNFVKYNMSFDDSLDLYLTDHPEYSNDPNVIYTYTIKYLYHKRLDYVWLKDIGPRAMHPINYKVIFNNVNGKRLSDHLGVLVDMQFH